MYSLLIHFYAFIVALIAPVHRKARKMRAGQAETDNILRKNIDKNARYIWFHAASLGEFEQGRPMIEKLKKQHPEFKILLTFFSPSGYEVRKNYDGADVICYLPFDRPSNVKRFLDLANPSMAIFIKYEFWGNYLNELNRRGIPVYIISAIFRPDQLFFQWFGVSYRKMLHYFNRLFVQDDRSKRLLEEFKVDNVTVCGDTRFDRVIDIRNLAKDIPQIESFVKAKDSDESILIAGSSWPQDESILIPYFNNHKNLKLIIAPHEIHEEHLHSIEQSLKRPFVRFSEIVKDPESVKGKDCVIIDNFGLLSSIYRYGDMAYIGGGFGTGIHNTLEAAVYGIPVIFGPNHRKFREAYDLIKTKGAISISSSNDFEKTMDDLLGSDELLKEIGSNAGTFVSRNAGATEKIMKIIFP